MADNLKSTARLADRASSLFVKLAVVLLVAYCLRMADVVPEVTGVIAWLAFIAVMIAGGVVLFAWVTLIETSEEVDPVTVTRPGQEPGRRTWKHNVFDENAYAVLGVPQDATREEIRDAYRQLVQRYHPDAVGPDDKERAALIFEHLDQAYELLSHAQNRFRYDAWLERYPAYEPTLDAVTQAFKHSATVAQFDTEFAPWMKARAEDTSPHQEPRNEPAFAPEHSRPTNPEPAAQGEVPTVASPPTASCVPPPEVEIPDAIREALGLPPAGQATQDLQ